MSGILNVLASEGAVSAPSYSGPGDIVSGASYWYGLRAYSAAYAASLGNAIQIVDSAGAHALDIPVTSSGDLNAATIAGWGGSGTMSIKTMYDQTGNGRDVTQGTVANMPTLVANVIGTLYGAHTTGASENLTGPPFTQAQPFTTSFVAERTGTVAFGDVLNNGSIQVGFDTSANRLLMYAGSSIPAITANDNVFHAAQMLFSHAVQSVAYVDGSSNNVSIGATTGTSGVITIFGGANQMAAGYIMEVGLWPSAFNGTQNSNMNTNQHTYWGF